MFHIHVLQNRPHRVESRTFSHYFMHTLIIFFLLSYELSGFFFSFTFFIAEKRDFLHSLFGLFSCDVISLFFPPVLFDCLSSYDLFSLAKQPSSVADATCRISECELDLNSAISCDFVAFQLLLMCEKVSFADSTTDGSVTQSLGGLSHSKILIMTSISPHFAGIS